MIICDENNKCYRVNDKLALLAIADNDSLLDILKYTYYNYCISKDVISLIDQGVLISSDNDDEFNIEELSDGVEFLKKELSELLTPEIVKEAIDSIDCSIPMKNVQLPPDNEK